MQSFKNNDIFVNELGNLIFLVILSFNVIKIIDYNNGFGYCPKNIYVKINEIQIKIVVRDNEVKQINILYMKYFFSFCESI